MIGADAVLARLRELEHSPRGAAHNGPEVVPRDSRQQAAPSPARDTAAHSEISTRVDISEH